MAYHSSFKWSSDDEPADEVVAEIVAGLKWNKEYNGGGTYTPDAYGSFSLIDSMIFEIGKFLDIIEGKTVLVEKLIEKFVTGAPGSVCTVAGRVIEELRNDT